MKSRRPDHVIPSSMPSSPIEGVSDYKQIERVNIKSRIPQMVSPASVRRRTPSKKPADCHSCETTRPKSASSRPAPAHPSQLLHGTRQNRAEGKDKAPLKQTSTRPKTIAPFRPPTPVIKVPITTIPLQRGVLGREDRDTTDLSVYSNDLRSDTNNLRDSKNIKDDRRRMLSRLRWQENIAKFESIKRQLYEKQGCLLELYAILSSSYQELSDMGQNVCLPPAEELKIMNVSKLGPGQLLQLCAGTEVNEIVNTVPPIDIQLLNIIPNNIVATCQKTLNSRKEIITWFEDVVSKKMITKNNLVKKIKEFKIENDETQRILDKNREDYTRFLDETCENFKKSENDTLANVLRLKSYSSKLAEMNAVTEDLRRKLVESQQQLVSAAKRSRELENELKDEKHKKKDHIAKADIQVKSKEAKIVQLTAALEQANSKSLSMERTVSQLREENQKCQSNYDQQMKKLQESVDINPELFDEMIADRSKLLTEKQNLEKELMELRTHYEEILHNTKHESNSNVAKFIEAEKKYNEALKDKDKLEIKVESLCAQLVESELRFKEVLKQLAEMEDASNDGVQCRKEMETLICQLASANKELMEYKELITNQKEALRELEENCKKSEEQSKSELNNNKKYILELELKQSFLEQLLKKSEFKTISHAEELSNLKNHINQLLKGFGEFESWEELHEMVKLQNLQLSEATAQKNDLTAALNKKEIELQQREKTITEHAQLIEEKEASLKMLMVKNEEQSNIITLLRNNLEARTQADIEFNEQIVEKNAEIQSLVTNLEKRKQQISELEKIIQTLEMQTLKLSHQKRTARDAISSLEKKLSEYESYCMINSKNTESSAENLDDLINILEYELTNPSEGPLKYNSGEYLLGSKRITEFQNKRGIKCHPENNSRAYQSQESVPTRRGNSKTYITNTDISNEVKHESDNIDGNKFMKGVKSSGFAVIPKMAVSATLPHSNDEKTAILPALHQIRNANYSFAPNSIRDEKKIKMFKLAGHRLQ